jgi:hypothetical protein
VQANYSKENIEKDAKCINLSACNQYQSLENYNIFALLFILHLFQEMKGRL